MPTKGDDLIKGDSSDWKSAEYDDEATLITLRSTNPDLSWPMIYRMLIDRMPDDRKRTYKEFKMKMEAICNNERLETMRAPASTSSQASIDKHVMTGPYQG